MLPSIAVPQSPVCFLIYPPLWQYTVSFLKFSLFCLMFLQIQHTIKGLFLLIYSRLLYPCGRRLCNLFWTVLVRSRHFRNKRTNVIFVKLLPHVYIFKKFLGCDYFFPPLCCYSTHQRCIFAQSFTCSTPYILCIVGKAMNLSWPALTRQHETWD